MRLVSPGWTRGWPHRLSPQSHEAVADALMAAALLIAMVLLAVGISYAMNAIGSLT